MNPQDKMIRLAYFELAEIRRERIQLLKVWHPELMKWVKSQGVPPPVTEVMLDRRVAFTRLGKGEDRYQHLVLREASVKAEFEDMARDHPLWLHFERIKGLGAYLCGAFVAAGGDIARAPTVSTFWSGMGLGLVIDEDGNAKVPRHERRRRTLKPGEKRRPCLPFVAEIGEQIRQQIERSSGSRMRDHYLDVKDFYLAKYPDRARMFNRKAAQRHTQKRLYACLWREWRLARGLPAPEPYAFTVLGHDGSGNGRMNISDFYDR